MIILEDMGNKVGLHEIKNKYWQNNNIEIKRFPLPVGDYVLCNEKIQDVIDRKSKRGIEIKKMDLLGAYNISVDTKKGLQEICGNVCGRQHDRFRDEIILAQNNGIKLYILIENKDNVTCLKDLFSWSNPRLFIRKGGKQAYPGATRGVTLAKACITLEHKYGCKFLFCKPSESAKIIIELLSGE